MKLFRFGLNIWITITSLLSFLLGWVALAHAPKPVQPQTQTQAPLTQTILPTLTPLQDQQFGSNTNTFQNFSVQQNSNNFQPVPLFRTSGS